MVVGDNVVENSVDRGVRTASSSKGLKGQSHRGANGKDAGRQTEKKSDETRQRRRWECVFHRRNKRLYEPTTIFEERARAPARTAPFYERTQDRPCRGSFLPVPQNETFPRVLTPENNAPFPFCYYSWYNEAASDSCNLWSIYFYGGSTSGTNASSSDVY